MEMRKVLRCGDVEGEKSTPLTGKRDRDRETFPISIHHEDLLNL
jgi:hypothetical protein